MTESQDSQANEAQIAVHWREEEYIYPPDSFIAQANANDPAIYDRFTEDKFPDCFTEYADLVSWDEPWQTILDTSNPPFWKWFGGGKLNASYNCVDRHAEATPDKPALIWVQEPETDPKVFISYADLYRRVNEFAALLRDFCGLSAGDRVTLHMPMVPELPVAMLACARLGVVHSQVFAGFSGNACGTRIADSGSRVLITMDGYYRSGDLLDHKVKADEAVAEAKRQGQDVDKVLVFRRHAGQYASAVPMADGRDFHVDDLIGQYAGQTVAPVSMPAEAPLFLMYTSRHHRPPQGLPAQHRRLPVLRRRDVQVLPGHPPRRHLLVHGRHRLDHRPLLHRLRPACAGHHQRDLRGHAELPGRGPPLADRPGARGEHLPHLADRDPDAPQGRTGRADEVRLPLQAHDHRGRADRARGVALVSLRGRQGRGGHRRHLVADRDRRVPGQRAAGPQADEAGLLRARRARHLPGHLRRGRQHGRGGQRPGRQHLHPQPVARDLPDHLGPARAVRRGRTTPSTTRTRTARTGATGRTSPATARCSPPTATSGSSAGWTT